MRKSLQDAIQAVIDHYQNDVNDFYDGMLIRVLEVEMAIPQELNYKWMERSDFIRIAVDQDGAFEYNIEEFVVARMRELNK